MKFQRIYLRLIILFVIFLCSNFVLFLLLKTTLGYANEYFNGKSEFFSLQEKIKNFYIQEKAVRISQNKASIIEKSFLTTNDFVDFIKELENLGPRHNVTVNIRSVVSPTKEKPYFILQLGIAGSFPNFLKVLFALENNPFSSYRLINIQKISINRVISGAAENPLSQEFSVNAELELWVYAKL